MTQETILAAGALSAAFLAIFGLLLALTKIWRVFNRLMVRVNDFFDDWNGVEHGAASMPDRVSALERDVAEIREQVTPNGGDTKCLGDRVMRIEQQLNQEGN